MTRHVLAAAIVATIAAFAGPAAAAPVSRGDMAVCDRVIEQPADSNVEVCCWDTVDGNSMCIMCTKGTDDCESFDPQVRITVPVVPKVMQSAPLTEVQ